VKQNLSITSLFKPAKLRALLSFGIKGYLTEIGWFNAFNTKSPVDENNNPIPWVTYSFIDFIKERIKPSHLIFEFGSGNSTYFYAKTASKVVSVEHDKEWFDKISKTKLANSEMIFCELDKGGSYCQMPVIRKEKFHLIIVDGRDRVNCCLQAVKALTDDGVIILDDSERDFYSSAVAFLKSKGFKELSFSGISPGLFYKKSTSVFYKAQNCLEI
jgi:hypothetical protein